MKLFLFLCFSIALAIAYHHDEGDNQIVRTRKILLNDNRMKNSFDNWKVMPTSRSNFTLISSSLPFIRWRNISTHEEYPTITPIDKNSVVAQPTEHRNYYLNDQDDYGLQPFNRPISGNRFMFGQNFGSLGWNSHKGQNYGFGYQGNNQGPGGIGQNLANLNLNNPVFFVSTLLFVAYLLNGVLTLVDRLNLLPPLSGGGGGHSLYRTTPSPYASPSLEDKGLFSNTTDF